MSRPNILLAISDDQSWRHAGAYGLSSIKTPAFDRVACEGVLFNHAYCPAPQCSPSRAALLTGRNIWELEEAGTHESLFPSRFETYPDLLEGVGYHVGYTGKPWGPGNWRAGGCSRNPAGVEYNQHRLTPPTSGISPCDYATNFQQFLAERPEGAPFCFWFGCREPHRPYETGSGVRAGKLISDCDVPGFLPDDEVVRQDLLDYELEIEWFDEQLARMIAHLDQLGELDHTLIVVTSDNGMPFPRAKANLYEYGTRVPLAVSWRGKIPGGRVVQDFVTLADLAPTFLHAAKLAAPSAMSAHSLMEVLQSEQFGWVDPLRDHAVTGKERHNHARFDNVGYPCRAVRTRDLLYIWNMKPDRWPLGDPPGYFCHTKMANPTKELILAGEPQPFFDSTYAKRGGEELFLVEEDLACLRNLSAAPEFADRKRELRTRLQTILRQQGDPRVLGYGDVFDSYPHYAPKQPVIAGFNADGEYNETYWQEAERKAGHTLTRNILPGHGG